MLAAMALKISRSRGLKSVRRSSLVACDVGGEGDAVGDGQLDEGGHALVFAAGEEVSGYAGGGGLIPFFCSAASASVGRSDAGGRRG